MESLIDLHMHTAASDGTQTCEELLAELRLHGIREFAITDHDSTDSVSEMAKLLSVYTDLVFHPGVEFSVTLDGGEYHLTAYDFDLHDEGITGLLADNKAIRRNNDVELISDIAPRYGIDVEAFLTYRADPKRGGWESLNFLIDQAVVPDLLGYFRLYEECGRHMRFDHPERAISAVKAARGRICLAHPSGYNSRSLTTVKQLDLWRDLGIQGIECYNSTKDSEEQRALYLQYCRDKDLFITGGSDYHGTFAKRELGIPPLTPQMLRIWS